MLRKPRSGVTLIELMIAVAVVGILALIALPAFRASSLRAGRSTGASCLLDAQYRLDAHYARTARAATSLAEAGIAERCGDGPRYRLQFTDRSTCTYADSPGSYALRAEGEDRQADDGDLLLCVAPAIADTARRLERRHSRPGSPTTTLPGWDFRPGP